MSYSPHSVEVAFTPSGVQAGVILLLLLQLLRVDFQSCNGCLQAFLLWKEEVWLVRNDAVAAQFHADSHTLAVVVAWRSAASAQARIVGRLKQTVHLWQNRKQRAALLLWSTYTGQKRARAEKVGLVLRCIW